MKEVNSELADRRAQALARLAVLQRLKEQAVAGDRASMFRSIDMLMEAESRALQVRKSRDSKPQSD